MIRALGLAFIFATASLVNTPSAAQPVDENTVSALLDEFGQDLYPEVTMLLFVGSIIEGASGFAPMCEGAKSGTWPDPLARLEWTPKSSVLLKRQITRCRTEYDWLYGYVADRMPHKVVVLDRIVDWTESVRAANKDEFLKDLASDSRGISYSCAVMLAITKLCRAAARGRL